MFWLHFGELPHSTSVLGYVNVHSQHETEQLFGFFFLIWITLNNKIPVNSFFFLQNQHRVVAGNKVLFDNGSENDNCGCSTSDRVSTIVRIQFFQLDSAAAGSDHGAVKKTRYFTVSAGSDAFQKSSDDLIPTSVVCDNSPPEGGSILQCS